MIYLETERLAPVTKHAHAKFCDFTADGESTNMDYAKLCEIWRKAGFDGCISMEIYGEGQERPEEVAKKGIELLRKYA